MSIRIHYVLIVLLLAVTAPLWAADAPAAGDAVARPAPVLTPAIEELVALAQKTSLPTPLTIVCLGDSITATNPRQAVKYPEMLQHALDQKYAGKVKVINAGRGGDNVTSALKRLEADVLAHSPDLVFVNLGINDSKLTAQSNYERNQIPLETFVTSYRDLAQQVKARTGAKVVAVGTIACVAEWTIRPTQNQTKKGTWFGKPEELNRYNAATRSLAGELGMDYVDLYDHFLAQPDLKALFSEPDGVHARDRGQEQVALQLMRYLVANPPKAAARPQ